MSQMLGLHAPAAAATYVIQTLSFALLVTPMRRLLPGSYNLDALEKGLLRGNALPQVLRHVWVGPKSTINCLRDSYAGVQEVFGKNTEPNAQSDAQEDSEAPDLALVQRTAPHSAGALTNIVTDLTSKATAKLESFARSIGHMDCILTGSPRTPTLTVYCEYGARLWAASRGRKGLARGHKAAQPWLGLRDLLSLVSSFLDPCEGVQRVVDPSTTF
ncbi:hypothetical protein B0H16DRAFT_1464054 [Mycena metata]|uniref:Uncharacterized protein n=1 Tax=Mycena metata TaxID=1033252 RepID=A0AAD7N2G6_9AGAR|nr:hypothetical protein B0H16DRAFT_1464054 [Mycena metata]